MRKPIEDSAGLAEAIRTTRMLIEVPSPNHIVFSYEEAPRLLGKILPRGVYAIVINDDGYKNLHFIDEIGDYHLIYEDDYPNA